MARGRFDLVVVTREDVVVALRPDMATLRSVDTRATIVCAQVAHGTHRVVSRVFAPGSGIDEDPVTGSAHCTLASWYCPRLGVDTFLARQASRRGGTVRVTLHARDNAGRGGGNAERVEIAGQAVTVAETTLA